MSKGQIEEIADALYESDNKINVVIGGIEQVAEDIYNAGYRKQEWISVDERLPEDELSEEHKKKTIKVLVAIKAKNGITIRTQERFLDYTYSNGGERQSYWTWRFSRGEVTHWMPLPEPPKVKGGE